MSDAVRDLRDQLVRETVFAFAATQRDSTAYAAPFERWLAASVEAHPLAGVRKVAALRRVADARERSTR